jgi:hypothetical protein
MIPRILGNNEGRTRRAALATAICDTASQHVVTSAQSHLADLQLERDVYSHPRLNSDCR